MLDNTEKKIISTELPIDESDKLSGIIKDVPLRFAPWSVTSGTSPKVAAHKGSWVGMTGTAHKVLLGEKYLGSSECILIEEKNGNLKLLVFSHVYKATVTKIESAKLSELPLLRSTLNGVYFPFIDKRLKEG